MVLVGSNNKDDWGAAAVHYKRSLGRILRNWMACLGSFCISIVGGLTLTCWEIKYHQTYTQLWMVPLGLVFLATPPIVWLSIFVSDMLGSKTQQDQDRDQEHLAAADASSSSSSLPPATAVGIQHLSIHHRDPES